ncbi:MAG: acyl-CoA dehydrogenase family protein [Nitriliruptoraceae bacterium]|nr:acyl-CoA dehydrogenase family protein [Nitriliruptoraceae bacterium]
MSALTAPAPVQPFVLSDEQRALTEMVRDMLQSASPTERVREVMMDGGFDQTTYAQLAELGLTGLTIAEEHGGAGASFVELSVVFEELGRRLACVPMLSSAVLGTTAIQVAASAEQQAAWLPDVAAGTARLALVHLDPAGRLAADPGVRASASGDGVTLDGTAGYVIDGMSATHLVVAATTDEGLKLFHVPADADGIERRPIDVLDLTRPQATIVFSGVEVAADAALAGNSQAGLHAALTAGVVMLACEQVGGTREVLARTTQYARERVQFGRAIGSFQAVKHRLAEMLVQSESARSAAYHAARMLAAHEIEELRVAAPLAKSYCSEVYERSTADSIQLHGGIGFTWEHDAHLFFKRAKSSKLMFGSPKHHRALLADVLGL